MEPSFTPSLQTPEYREALAKAEAAAEAVSVDEESGRIAPEVTPEGVEAVPVSASDQPLEPETPETAEAEPVAETSEVEDVEVETPEQLREKIAQLEARIEEKDTFIGRQSGEVGELRQAVDALSQRLDSSTSAPAAATPAAPVTPITDELIENNPAQATILAFQQKDAVNFERALEAWKDPFTGDPFAAASWLAERRIEQANAQNEARLAELNARFEQLEKPAAEQAATNEWGRAFNAVAAEHPDFLKEDEKVPGRSNAERILTEVAPKYPALADQLGNGTAEQKAEILRVLYDLDRAHNSDPAAVQEQLETAAKEAAAEEAATRQAAAVVSGQSTTGQPAPDLTYEEQEQAAYRQRFEGKASLERGWTGRP